MVAVINDTLARVIAGDTVVANAIGRSFTLAGRKVEVIGVYATPPIEVPLLMATVPLPLMQLLSADSPGGGPFNSGSARLEITVAAAGEVDSVAAALRRYVDGREDWKGKVGVQASGPQRLEQVEQGMLVFKLAMGSFAGISLIVGGIGIMNVLLAAVAERTREIGIRKAAGARNRDILYQFLAESVAITSVGSGLGLVFGVGGASLVTWIMRQRTEAEVYAAVTPTTLITAALVAVVIGVVFGMVPALRASRLSPIDAIRHE
jgi:putative ABC transport system permease protein